KKMEGYSSRVQALAVSRNGQIIASGDDDGEFIAWHGETGESITQPIKTHSSRISLVDFSPDGSVLATGAYDGTTLCLWDLRTGVVLKKMEGHSKEVRTLTISRDGRMIASGDNNGEVIAWHGETGKSITHWQPIEAHANMIYSLDFSPDGMVLATATERNSTIIEWDSSTWQEVGHPWIAHTNSIINAIAIHPGGDLVVSASTDNYIRLWQLSHQRTIAIFQHSSQPTCVTFSVDGKHILSGDNDNKILEW
ncbi:quinon protein alcohol dehydrogenase-like superfamily, partial [Suillus tomentosus]